MSDAPEPEQQLRDRLTRIARACMWCAENPAGTPMPEDIGEGVQDASDWLHDLEHGFAPRVAAVSSLDRECLHCGHQWRITSAQHETRPVRCPKCQPDREGRLVNCDHSSRWHDGTACAHPSHEGRLSDTP